MGAQKRPKTAPIRLAAQSLMGKKFPGHRGPTRNFFSWPLKRDPRKSWEMVKLTGPARSKGILWEHPRRPNTQPGRAFPCPIQRMGILYRAVEFLPIQTPMGPFPSSNPGINFGPLTDFLIPAKILTDGAYESCTTKALSMIQPVFYGLFPFGTA